MAIPSDTVTLIKELQDAGYGRDRIGMITGEPSDTVRLVMEGKRVRVCQKMTTRQRAYLL